MWFLVTVSLYLLCDFTIVGSLSRLYAEACHVYGSTGFIRTPRIPIGRMRYSTSSFVARRRCEDMRYMPAVGTLYIQLMSD